MLATVAEFARPYMWLLIAALVLGVYLGKVQLLKVQKGTWSKSGFALYLVLFDLVGLLTLCTSVYWMGYGDSAVSWGLLAAIVALGLSIIGWMNMNPTNNDESPGFYKLGEQGSSLRASAAVPAEPATGGAETSAPTPPAPAESPEAAKNTGV